MLAVGIGEADEGVGATESAATGSVMRGRIGRLQATGRENRGQPDS
jgi:hypothetical protein